MPDNIEANRIFVFLPNWLGDVAMCTPALRAIHNRFPEAQLSVAGKASSVDLVRGLPWISDYASIPHRPGLFEMLKLGAKFKALRGDIAVIFPHSSRPAIIAFLARVKRRIGYDRGARSFWLTERVPPHRVDGKIKPIYMVDEYLGLLKPLGCADDGQGLELHADATAVETVRAHMRGTGPVVGFAPGAAFGPSKQWPIEGFISAIDALADKAGAQCVLLTGPGEGELKEEICDRTKVKIICCDDGEPSIETLKATISQLDLLICNDSGPRHIAISFDVPAICVMGPTSPDYTAGPYEKGEVIRIDVDCGPCQKPVCETDHRCMTGISTETVINSALKYLPRD